MRDPVVQIPQHFEQDHRSIKSCRLGLMFGFYKFRRAATTIAGTELMHRIRKGSVQTR